MVAERVNAQDLRSSTSRFFFFFFHGFTGVEVTVRLRKIIYGPQLWTSISSWSYLLCLSACGQRARVGLPSMHHHRIVYLTTTIVNKVLWLSLMRVEKKTARTTPLRRRYFILFLLGRGLQVAKRWVGFRMYFFMSRNYKSSVASRRFDFIGLLNYSKHVLFIPRYVKSVLARSKRHISPSSVRTRGVCFLPAGL